ncbi:tyrosine-type recombinase/integrase [Lolliginicoccus suaedae]|uniref:tyrosine-type recombinase/integrase n=1 Tax=Lolliginicoccus suaedae TaxID=2605429 RepID=UPI001659DC08|nr:site-specific integrase [Lolliginicoccus suaedae]
MAHETKRLFGNTRQLKSGRWQARYTGPDLSRHKAPQTFATREDAQAWLAERYREIRDGLWEPPSVVARKKAAKKVTFCEYASQFLDVKRATGLAPRTLEGYQRYLDRFLLPAFGPMPLADITPDAVRNFYAGMQFQGRRKDATGGTQRAHVYGLLSSIMRAAEDEDKIVKSPCRIRGAARPQRLQPADEHFVEQPLWLQKDVFNALVPVLPEQWQIAPVLGLFGALRFGEVVALRRKDISFRDGALHVRRGVSRTRGEVHERQTKTLAGRRTVFLPPTAMVALRDHLDAHTGTGRDALVVSSVRDPAQHLSWSAFQRHWAKARSEAGHDELTFHHLRHAGISLFARCGATPRENEIRSGHSAATISHHYQHTDPERMGELARRMDEVWAEAIRIHTVIKAV